MALGGNPTTVAAAVLKGIGAPVNNNTLGAMVGWFHAEGGHWNNSASFNPLNTTLNAPGARSINGVGVKAYNNWAEGINATVSTLRQPNMSGIVNAFKQSNPRAVISAIGQSPWGTSGSLVAQTIDNALGQKYSVPANAGIASSMSSPSLSVSPFSITIPGATHTNVDAALTQALLNDSTGSGGGRNLLSDALGLIDTGRYTTTTPARSVQLPMSRLTEVASGKALGPGNDINPLAHFTLGRTDMGVDANAAPGTPVLAPNDGVVVGHMENWYNGQPYLAFKLTSGPNTGKIMYVAEQIDQLAPVGARVSRGGVLARYATSGTGIEAGWASPQNWQQTLAQATGNTGGPGHSNSPSGQSFRNYLGLL